MKGLCLLKKLAGIATDDHVAEENYDGLSPQEGRFLAELKSVLPEDNYLAVRSIFKSAAENLGSGAIHIFSEDHGVSYIVRSPHIFLNGNDYPHAAMSSSARPEALVNFFAPLSEPGTNVKIESGNGTLVLEKDTDGLFTLSAKP